jgi:hypothetical protein
LKERLALLLLTLQMMSQGGETAATSPAPWYGHVIHVHVMTMSSPPHCRRRRRHGLQRREQVGGGVGTEENTTPSRIRIIRGGVTGVVGRGGRGKRQSRKSSSLRCLGNNSSTASYCRPYPYYISRYTPSPSPCVHLDGDMMRRWGEGQSGGSYNNAIASSQALASSHRNGNGTASGDLFASDRRRSRSSSIVSNIRGRGERQGTLSLAALK